MADDRNHQFFDRYSLVHMAMGATFEASRVPAPLAIGSHVVFEALENPIKETVASIWPDARPDAIENQVGDVASFTVGYYVARWLKGSEQGKLAVAGFVGIAAALWVFNLFEGHSWKKA